MMRRSDRPFGVNTGSSVAPGVRSDLESDGFVVRTGALASEQIQLLIQASSVSQASPGTRRRRGQTSSPSSANLHLDSLDLMGRSRKTPVWRSPRRPRWCCCGHCSEPARPLLWRRGPRCYARVEATIDSCLSANVPWRSCLIDADPCTSSSVAGTANCSWSARRQRKSRYTAPSSTSARPVAAPTFASRGAKWRSATHTARAAFGRERRPERSSAKNHAW